VTGILLTLTAAALGAVFFDESSAKYPVLATTASTTAATISGSARVIDGDTVVVAGTHVRLKGVDAAEYSANAHYDHFLVGSASAIPPASH
jgi:endonuclease YncB( thermonuclease family)